MGEHSQTGREILLREGQYGPYLEFPAQNDLKRITSPFPQAEFQALLEDKISIEELRAVAEEILQGPKVNLCFFKEDLDVPWDRQTVLM